MWDHVHPLSLRISTSNEGPHWAPQISHHPFSTTLKFPYMNPEHYHLKLGLVSYCSILSCRLPLFTPSQLSMRRYHPQAPPWVAYNTKPISYTASLGATCTSYADPFVSPARLFWARTHPKIHDQVRDPALIPFDLCFALFTRPK